MLSENFFTISDFAKLLGISRQTLIYYDNINLFKPTKILSNKYRVYSRNQINIISLILTLTEIGVPLKDIKKIVANISTDTALEILKRQLAETEAKIQKLNNLKEFMSLRIEQISVGKNITNEKSISLVEFENDTPLYIGKEINCKAEDFDDKILMDFYSDCEKMGIPLIFSAGQIKNYNQLISKNYEVISAICIKLKNYTFANAIIPKGKYVVGYAYGDYDQTDDIYEKIYDFIEKNNLKIVGNAYEEYLIDEFVQQDPNNFVMQISVQVK